MAIIACPGCGKRISSISPLCPHCGFERGEVDDEQVSEFRRRQLRERIYRLKMASYVAITLMLAGFGWYWFGGGVFEGQTATRGPVILVALGAVAYVLVRVLLFNARRALRQLAQGG